MDPFDFYDEILDDDSEFELDILSTMVDVALYNEPFYQDYVMLEEGSILDYPEDIDGDI